MSNRDDQSWDEWIDDLKRLGWLEDDWDRQGSKSPGLALASSAVLLAKLLRDASTPPPSRIAAGISGAVHFEWYKSMAHVVITVAQVGQAEIVSYRDTGIFTSESFRWGASLEALPSSLGDTFD